MRNEMAQLRVEYTTQPVCSIAILLYDPCFPPSSSQPASNHPEVISRKDFRNSIIHFYFIIMLLNSPECVCVPYERTVVVGLKDILDEEGCFILASRGETTNKKNNKTLLLSQ